jgi:hypothetical protein
MSVLAALVLAGCSKAAGDEPVVLEVHPPTGAVEITDLHAERVDSLEGKTICLLSDRAWESHRTFPLIGDELTTRYPGGEVVAAQDLPDIYGVEPDVLVSAIEDHGCQAAVVGNAA